MDLVRKKKLDLKKSLYELLNYIPSISNNHSISISIHIINELIIEEATQLKKSKVPLNSEKTKVIFHFFIIFNYINNSLIL